MARFWWLLHKDLLSEYRSWKTWPTMILLGMTVALVFSAQWNEQEAAPEPLIGGLLWMVVFFAGTLAIHRSFGVEREDGCWKILLQYPISPSTIYLAKLCANLLMLLALLIVLVPLLCVLCGVGLLNHPVKMALVALLGALGISATGTLVSALAPRANENTGLTMLLGIPLMVPIILVSAKATYLAVSGNTSAEWWFWIQLLVGCDVVFVTIGILLFGFVVEE